MFPNRQKLNIDGVWLVIPDTDKVGEEKGWFLTPPVDKGVEVILPMKEPFLEIPHTSDLWFIKEFHIQDTPNTTLLFLYLQNINFKSVIWLNGHYVGTHEGAFTQFHFDITRFIQQGNNLLVIKVSSYSHNFTLVYNPSWIPYPGIWGNIYIEFVPIYHIQKVQVRPDIRGKRVVTNVYANNKNGTLRAKIPELDVEIQETKPKLVIPLEHFEVWSPHSPRLYTFQIEFTTDTSSDTAEISFGMRDFSINEKQFTLNFKPCLVKAYPFYWNIKDLNTPSYSEEVLEEFFRKLLKANFNLVISYGQPLPEKIIRICDKVGILVAETPSLQFDVHLKKARELAEREIGEFLNNNINHPSLVWLRFEYTSEDFNTTHFIRKLRQIDRSRLISLYPSIPFSPKLSYYCIPYNVDLLPMRHIWIQSDDYMNRSTQNLLEHIGDTQIPHFVVQLEPQKSKTETLHSNNRYEQYISKIKEGFIERDLVSTLQSVENFVEQINEICMSNLQHYVNSILWNLYIKGYSVKHISDKNIFYSHDFCDFLKVSDKWLKSLQQTNNSFRLNISMEKTNLLQDEETAVNIAYIGNDHSLEKKDEKITLSLSITSPTQQVLWKKRKDIKLKKDNKILWTGNISGSRNIGQHTLIAQLSINNKVISEISRNFYVLSTPETTQIPVKFIEIQKHYSQLCDLWVKEALSHAPLYIIPPLYNSVFAYPPEEFLSMMEQVKNGAIGIIFSPPDDWHELNTYIPNCPTFTQINLDYPKTYRHFHYAKLHPIFLNIPNRCLLKQEYRNILPTKVFLEKGDEDICGCFIIPEEDEKEPFWGSDILVTRYGIGKLVFVHLKILENITDDPIAQHLFVNMVNYFARRAIPSNEDILLPQHMIEQFKLKREQTLRQWMVIGEFPIIEDPHNEQAYPTIETLDLTATYWGKYGEIKWKPYYTHSKENHLLDFHKALSLPINPCHLMQDNGVAFAYAEFNYEDKKEAIIQIQTSNRFVLWFNNNKIMENLTPSSQVQLFEGKVTLRKWKNTIFIKLIKDKGEHSFTLDFYDTKRKKIYLIW